MVSRSREGAWIEISKALQDAQKTYGRSREGAWIEIDPTLVRKSRSWRVAPARERGLKYADNQWCSKRPRGRSREGAWIEIVFINGKAAGRIGRSREGAWIEILWSMSRLSFR